MSKAVLVMDMPESCRKCNLRVIGSVNFCTGADCRKIDQMEIINEDIKPDWCPLKPMPEKRNAEYKPTRNPYITEGYNACIDEILGN